MALTINTHPEEVITNAPEFDVTTSLSEDASHQNLRIRATVYMGGVSSPIAVLEQAKDLDDWDLFDLLKSLTGKCDVAAGGSVSHIQPSIGSELLTGWTNLGGLFETFTTSARTLTSIIDSNASGGIAASNDLGAVSAGDIFIVGIENDWNDSGAADFLLKLVESIAGDLFSFTQYAGLSSDKLIANHIYLMHVPNSKSTSYVYLQTAAGLNAALTGTLTVHKITNFRNNPGVYFHVKFEEVYENISNVTTIGANTWADTLLFIPAIVRPGETFSDYLSTTGSSKFLNRGEDGAWFYKFGIGMELRSMYAATSAYVRSSVVVDAGILQISSIPNTGWGMIVVNETAIAVDAQDETIEIGMWADQSPAGTLFLFAEIIIDCELNCYPDIKALSFIGDLGEEIILFRGLPSEDGGAEKSFIKDQNRIRKVLKAYKHIIMILRTIYETEEIRRLLYELVYTELTVWMYDSDFTDNYREVTVISDKVPIENQKALIESEIEVEYYE